MKINLTKTQIVIGVVVIVGIICLFVFYKPKTEQMNGNNATSSMEATNTAVANTAQTTSNATQSNVAKKVVTSKTISNVVDIYKTSYLPTALTINKGSTVTWINKDTQNHKVIANINGPTSGDLLPGQSYSYKFMISGIYGYHDYSNSTTTGTIIVK